MPQSLAPLLAAAVAMFVLLISNNPVLGLLAGFVSWRALRHLATHGGVVDAENVRNPLPNRSPNPANSAIKPARASTPAQSGRAVANAVANEDGPPLLTDLLKSGRDFFNSRSDDDVADRQSDDESYRQNLRSSQTSEIKQPPVSSSRKSSAEMHGTPAYMQQLSALDLRISLGEITDAEYDAQYDRILRNSSQ